MTANLLTYLLVINLITLVVSIFDKGFAVHDKPRVPEKLLLALSFAGGAVGAKLAQIICGHKRLKIDYCASLSLIAFLQLGTAVALWTEVAQPTKSPQFEALMARFDQGEDGEARGVRHVSDDRALPRRFGPGS